MKWFRSKNREPGEPDPDQAVTELLDQYHSRASVTDGDQLLIGPGKVLDNIAFAMERIDTDISTPVSIDEDVAPRAEVVGMIQELRMGAVLAVHVVNNAMRIMSARYPADLVRAPLPSQYDLRKLIPVLRITDQQHETARMIFNRRAASPADLTQDDVPELKPLDWEDQRQIFMTLFYMFGTKVAAIKHRTGIS